MDSTGIMYLHAQFYIAVCRPHPQHHSGLRPISFAAEIVKVKGVHLVVALRISYDRVVTCTLNRYCTT